MKMPEANNSSIYEILDFVQKGKVLEKHFSSKGAEYEFSTTTITGFDSIERFRDPNYLNSEIQGDLSWVDIQRVDEHNCPTLTDSDIWEALEEIDRDIHDSLKRQLSSFLKEYEIQEIAGFFQHLIYLRATKGRSDDFHESLFIVYQAGGYPCGWSGCYPDGELVVYSRCSDVG